MSSPTDPIGSAYSSDPIGPKDLLFDPEDKLNPLPPPTTLESKGRSQGSIGDIILPFLFNSISFGLAVALAYEWRQGRWEQSRNTGILDQFLVASITCFIAFLLLYIMFGFKM